MSMPLSNNPIERSFVNYPFVICDKTFSYEEIFQIKEYIKDAPLEEASVITNNDGNKIINDIRKNKVSFHEFKSENSWIFERINNFATRVNDNYYNFDLNGYDAFQYAEYHGNDQGHYDYHMDMAIGSKDTFIESQRKLSMSLLLNEPGEDFEGGEFLLNLGKESSPLKVELKRGQMVFFPSFILHRVSPVTKGVRKSIVVWILGPKFK